MNIWIIIDSNIYKTVFRIYLKSVVLKSIPKTICEILSNRNKYILDCIFKAYLIYIKSL